MFEVKHHKVIMDIMHNFEDRGVIIDQYIKPRYVKVKELLKELKK